MHTDDNWEFNRSARLYKAASSLTTDQAVKYLEHGAKMKETLKQVKADVLRGSDEFDYVFELLTKLEVK